VPQLELVATGEDKQTALQLLEAMSEDVFSGSKH
jgi:phosphotransferase system HPr-like phosphotransfer protein